MSDTPSHATGFGLVTREVCSHLLGRDHMVRNLAWWCDAADQLPGFDIVPCPVSPRGACEAVKVQIEDFRPDVLVTLGDIPWVNYLARPEMRAFLDKTGTPWCAYFPIDGCCSNGGLPDRWLQTLRQVDMPIAMSAFGVQVCATSGIVAALIPHGCDTRLFAPRADTLERRAAIGLSGQFVVLSDCRNHRRKMIPRLLDIFRLFQRRRANSVLLLNTNTRIEDDPESYSYNLLNDIETLGLTRHVRLPKTGGSLAISEIASLYAVADVHLLTSFGEGFGLPTLQAAASGVVPIAGAHSANTELLGRHGLAIAASGIVLDEFGLERHFIDRNEAVAALDRLAADGSQLKARALGGVVFARQFAWPVIADQWEAQLGQVRLASRPPSLSMLTGHSTVRPTGHDTADLPLPRLGIPAYTGAPEHRPARFTVLADPDCISALQPLPPLFGNITLAPLQAGDHSPPTDPAGDEQVILVVDPAGHIPSGPRRPHTAYIGPADLPECYDPLTLLLRCREVLTDYLAASRRALHGEEF